MLGDFRVKPRSKWPWLLWWRADQDDLQDQVAKYDSLSWLDSFRKLSVLFLLVAGAGTFVMATIVKSYSVYVDIGLWTSLTPFIYRGHRWAMIAAMILWTFEKIVGTATQLSASPAVVATIPVSILWWAVFMHAFYMAFLVERLRKKQTGKPVPDQANPV